MDYVGQLKELLPDPRSRIKLHDLIAEMTKTAVSEVGTDQFGVQAPSDSVSFNATFIARLHKYEEITRDLLLAEVLIGRWGVPDQQEIATVPLRRLAGGVGPTSGNAYLIQARWYPVFLLLYAGCIGAMSGNNYEMVYKLAHSSVPNPYGSKHGGVLLNAAFSAMTEIHDGFKLLPGFERKHTPRSEYLFTLLQPDFEEILYLGTDYEAAFDRAEAIMAVEYMHIENPGPVGHDEQIWGPIGRFGWKTQHNPLGMLIAEASGGGSSWQPARAGLFAGSSKRFIELAESLSRMLSRSSWSL